jgi:hypothetical protein
LADEADIEQWAQRIAARSELSRLVRGLVAQTNDQVVTLQMRAAEGTGVPGYDGIVEATRGTPFVPMGRSVWELGSGADAQSKAEADYQKRTADPLGEDPAETTFVVVTARRWGGKDKWSAEKRSDGIWREVKVFDADDLVIALESAPAIHFWFSELIGKPAAGVRTIEDWWQRFSASSQPVLSPGLVLAGRQNQAADLVRILDQDAQLTQISAPSTDDVLAFVAATILTTGEDVRDDLLSRTLIVLDAVSLRQLDTSSGLLILLPFDEELRREAQLIRSHHVVIVAPGDVPADIQLPPVDRDVFAELLKEMGVAEEQVGPLTKAAYLSLVAFQRQAPATGRQPTRDWANKFESKVVRRAWMAGSWTDRRSGDQDAVAALIGVPYEDASDELRRISRDADPILIYTAGSWTVVEPSAAWEYTKSLITSSDVQSFESTVQTVLGSVDPALELPVEQRWAAGIYGKTRVHSTDLRRGLSRTLALFGARGNEITLTGGSTLRSVATAITGSLLQRANEDESGQLWASLSDVLPLLAEAAPDAFLHEVDKGLGGDSPVLRTIFLDNQGDALTVSSPHTGLLWALETVAWSSEHFGMAVRSLARLAEVDPGGRLSNRPSNSLGDVFRPWLPQTTATPEGRLAALDVLIDNHPDVTFPLLLRLLPETHAVGMYSHKPMFRDWKRDSEGVTIAEYWDFVSAVVDRALAMADDDGDRWIELVARYDDVPPPKRAEILGAMERLATTLDSIEKEHVWESANKLVGHHRSYPDADWSLPSDDIDALARSIEALKPTDPVSVARWMFQDHFPDIGVTRPTTFEEREALINERRSAAIQLIFDARGLNGVLELADAVAYPWFVGTSLATSGLDVDEDALLKLLAEPRT